MHRLVRVRTRVLSYVRAPVAAIVDDRRRISRKKEEEEKEEEDEENPRDDKDDRERIPREGRRENASARPDDSLPRIRGMTME